MTPQQPQALSDEELQAQSAEALPPREQMSLLDPGATMGTPAASLLPGAALGATPVPPEYAAPQ